MLIFIVVIVVTPHLIQLKYRSKNAAHVSSHIALRHDFHKNHGGPGGPCDKQGIMSYEPPSLPGTWSTCSRRDQEKAFRKGLHVCMAPSGGIRVTNDLT